MASGEMLRDLEKGSDPSSPTLIEHDGVSTITDVAPRNGESSLTYGQTPKISMTSSQT